ncbi:acyl-[acyl-carrier-protein] thioesterase [Porphyromonas levii]|uniref:acyl-[acyl-carrier-protein] thioesterase n=1 Tax=Porphyromonas levii TaxID=28114 RepID=UPI0003685B87|nr:acyl-ACP thioesterase domain-containing protein [Porphyromonas levii]MBR8703609.1 hypothetical protein [Porphyromonas levii]MBR8712645.1 hypothetical protein [Porphyromonas levii]MBR8714741.1 hypothetical protein [Porphyromonas levii]MBR8727225.1 hypothetical protein [Porphyromonas levii]MBR8729504.1 hypothetical protein [Porphyromonas levii]
MRRVDGHKLTIELELWPFHLDLRERYPLSQVVSRMIHVAGEHATHFGYGIGQLMEQGATWVLSRMSIQFFQPISIQEPLEISTGVTDWSGISTDRVITLSQGRGLVASSMTKWIAIDIKKRMPISIDKVLTDTSVRTAYPGLELPEVPRRLLGREETALLKTIYVHKVRYSDLDLNRHVNSSVWVSLAVDALPLERILQYRMTDVHLRFVKEGHYGDQLYVRHYSEGLTDYLQIEHDETTCFQLVIHWVKE